MHIGIFTYGTRGDVQPYIALALGLKERGYQVTIAAPENFKNFIEGYKISFHPLFGDVEEVMNKPEAEKVLKSENSIKLMKYFYQFLDSIKGPLRSSYIEGINKVDAVICNQAVMHMVFSIAEKQNKKIALSYFMPPMAITNEFPAQDLDFFNNPWYNRLTYKIIYGFYWKFLKNETNKFRQELGLPILKENLITYIQKKKVLDLYSFSKHLIPQPKDWAPNHKITGFLTIPAKQRELHSMDQTPEELSEWLQKGEKPVYIGFGSNGVGDSHKIITILGAILSQTTERILFCTGWGVYKQLPKHPNLFVCKYVNHEEIVPKCKIAIFHGGAGTLATMLRHFVPVIIISFYTDQPTWGKIIEREQLGFHIPIKMLTSEKLIKAIDRIQKEEIKNSVISMGQKIKEEDGLENALREITEYFGQ